MATRNQSDAIRQELNGAWQQISGSFNFSYTSIAGFPRLLLHHKGSLPVLATAGSILWLKPEYQVNGGAWTDSGSGPDGLKLTFPDGKDAAIVLQCNRPGFPTAYPPGTVINTRMMARCSGSVVLCDSLIVPQEEAIKTWSQSESHQWNEAEDDVESEFFFFQDYYPKDTGYYSYSGTRQGLTNRFSALIGENTHVQFWQPEGELDKFYSMVSEVTIENYEVTVTPGTVQEWDAPPALGGDREFIESVFINAGTDKIACRFDSKTEWQYYGWTVNTVSKSMSADYSDIDIRPTGYDAGYNVYGAGLVYIPDNSKIATILEQDGTYNRYPATFLYGSSNVMSIGTDRMFDPDAWTISTDNFQQANATVFGGEKVVYAIRLNSSPIGGSEKLLLFAVDTTGAIPPTKIAEHDHATVADMYPTVLIGDPNADRFVLVTGSFFANAPLIATLYSYSGGTITAVGSALELMPNNAKGQYGTGVWVGENLIHINAVTPGVGRPPVSTFILMASETGLELVDKWTEPFECQGFGMLGTAVTPALNVYTTTIDIDNSGVYINKYSALPINTAVTELESGVQHEAAVGYVQWRHFRIESVAGQTQVDITVDGNATCELYARKNWPARIESYDATASSPLAPINMAITGGETIWIMVQGPWDEVGGDPAATITATLS